MGKTPETSDPRRTAPLLGSLRLFAEAGIERVRAKSLAQTGYLMELMDAEGLTSPGFGYRIGTNP